MIKSELTKLIAQIYDQRKLHETGLHAIALINLRVKDGIDLSGNPFAQYSAKYLARKIKARAYSGRVDLTRTGNMLLDMKVSVSRDTANLHFEVDVGYIEGKSPDKSIKKARWHNTEGAGKSKVLRRFAGLTDSEREQILTGLK